jgi:hypothetical protein
VRAAQQRVAQRGRVPDAVEAAGGHQNR